MLVPIGDMLRVAVEQQYAIGAFDVTNLESTEFDTTISWTSRKARSRTWLPTTCGSSARLVADRPESVRKEVNQWRFS
jgi:hypothetical protein